MKINDIIKEDTEEEENDQKEYDRIIESDFFKKYYKPFIDKMVKFNDSLAEALDRIFNSIDTSTDLRFIVHGSSKVFSKTIYDFEYRKNSRDTYPFIHNYINEETKDDLGEPVRNLLFGTTAVRTAKTYGRSYHVIPLNEYTLFYNSKIQDLTMDLNLGGHSIDEILDYHYFINNPREDFLVLVDKIVNILKGTPLIDTNNRDSGEQVLYNIIEHYLARKTKLIYEQDLLKETIEKVLNKHGTEQDMKNVFEAVEPFFKEKHDDIKNVLDNYIEGIETTKDPYDINPNVELMIKFDKAAILSESRLHSLIAYYAQNN